MSPPEAERTRPAAIIAAPNSTIRRTPSQPDSQPARRDAAERRTDQGERRGGGGRGALGAELGGNWPERHRREQRRAVGDRQDDEGRAGNDPGRAAVHRRGTGFHLVHYRIPCTAYLPAVTSRRTAASLQIEIRPSLPGLYPICDRPVLGASFSPRSGINT